MKSSDLPPTAPLSALGECATQLRVVRTELEAAVSDLERIPALIGLAERAHAAGDAALGGGHEQVAQGIRERIASNRWRLDSARQDIERVLRRLSVANETARDVLAQIAPLSPYPSVAVADEILGLLDAFAESSGVDFAALPPERPTEGDRMRLAERLEQTMRQGDHSLKTARAAIGVAEATFNRLRSGRPVRPSTWRKVVRFLERPRS